MLSVKASEAIEEFGLTKTLAKVRANRARRVHKKGTLVFTKIFGRIANQSRIFDRNDVYTSITPAGKQKLRYFLERRMLFGKVV